MLTKKDIQEMFKQSDVRWDKRFNEADERWEKRFSKLRKEFKDDIETAVAQIMDSIMKWGTGFATKEDLKSFTTKEDLKGFREEVKSEFRDVRRQINDLKADLPTPQEFANHEKRITKLEVAVFPA